MQAKTVVEAKGWATSWTVIFNSLMVLAVSGNEVADLVSESGLFGSEVTKWLLLITGVGNILLRARTKQPLASSPIQSKAAQVPAPTPVTMNVTGGNGA